MRVRPGLAAVAAAGGALLTAAPASALDCAGFKTAMAAASDGDVITLDQGQTCNDTYTLPSDKPAPFRVTIQGGGLFGATLDGVGKSSSIISSAPSVGNQLHVTIRNLTFRNGTNPSGDGGAIHIGSGDVGVILAADHFLANKAPAGDGGAVWIQSTAGARDTVVKNSSFGDGTAAGANTPVVR